MVIKMDTYIIIFQVMLFIVQVQQEDIDAVYQTPDFDFGDVGTRKTLKYARVSFSPEGAVEPSFRVTV